MIGLLLIKQVVIFPDVYTISSISCTCLHNRVAFLAGHFRPYDYGLLENLKVYRQFIPPEYPIEKITVPVILYNGLNDFLANPIVNTSLTH